MQKEHSGIRSFAVESKKKKQVPTGDPEDVRRLARFAPYLNFLEFKLEMNHRIFKESKVAATLALLNTPGFYFPADIAERAARLVAKWEDEDWSEPEDQPVAQQQAPAPAPAVDGPASNNSNNANEEAPAVQIRVPSARDPLFGTNGIMHGVISTRNGAGRRVYMLNPRLPHQSSKEFGHNGLSVGQWFPMRLVALHHGAHGASQAGIYGNQKSGAFSIVAGNSTYHAFDQDQGDVLYYSAPRAHENKDPNRLASPASSGSLALRASHSSRRPVRVLRSAGGGSSSDNDWLPRCGLRYDGLYRVDAVREKKNASGGLYEQFKLVRLGANVNGDENLQEIARSSPSAAQAAAYRNLMDCG
ncbi:YDG/SRA domain-containing protein [Apiospora aurea]|uniref:YDG/SRA domain-containing protein n=1 Tax=Apiospora aurea TaxID=335848 RepID=A0ABR1Q7R4_9PEZI